MRHALLVLILFSTASIAQPAERVLRYDFPAVQAGVAENEEGPTGVTVFYFPKGATATIDVRGGSPGTINSDVLRLSYDSAFVDAITIAGGSSYGLEAANGVAAELRARRGNSGDWTDIAFVAGAIIFDLGPRRFNTAYPDKELGRAALRNAREGEFPLGARGAGRFAMQGGFFGGFEYRQHSGQGGAFRESGPTKVAVFTVVNSLGAIADREGRVVRCHQRGEETACPTIQDYLEDALRRRSATRTSLLRQGASENTTITVVVTNQKLAFWALHRLAVQVHTSMARAIQPFHTTNDGDVLFAVTTNEVDNAALPVDVLGLLASETAWDAVLNSIPENPARPGATVAIEGPALDRFTGTYELGAGARLTITRDDSRLLAEATGERDVYSFERNTRYRLRPVSPDEFVSDNPRSDRVRFTGKGLVLNPGPWELPARTLKER